jgi:hypothetical protein
MKLFSLLSALYVASNKYPVEYLCPKNLGICIRVDYIKENHEQLMQDNQKVNLKHSFVTRHLNNTCEANMLAFYRKQLQTYSNKALIVPLDISRLLCLN